MLWLGVFIILLFRAVALLIYDSVFKGADRKINEVHHHYYDNRKVIIYDKNSDRVE